MATRAPLKLVEADASSQPIGPAVKLVASAEAASVPASGRRVTRASCLSGFDIVTLRLLLAAGEEGNLGRVSERENIALSAVSRRISDFELRYGFAVFDRHDRGVTPTPEGAAMLKRIAAIVDQLELVAVDLVDRRDGAAGLIRVRAHTSASLSGALPTRIAEFMKLHPGIDIELEESTSLDIVHGVRLGTCDVGLISGTIECSGLEILPWQEDELVVLVPPASPLAGQHTLAFSDVAGEPFVGMQRESALQTLYRAQAAAMNVSLDERIHAMSFESVRAYVSAGLGVAILPAIAAYPYSEDCGFGVARLRDSWAHRPMMLCYKSESRLSAAARMFVRSLAAN